MFGKSGAFLEKWTGDVRLLGTWRYRGFTNGQDALERKLHFNGNFFMRGGWQAGASVLVERYGFDKTAYASYAVLDGGTLLAFSGPTLPNLDYVASVNTPRVHGVSVNLFYL